MALTNLFDQVNLSPHLGMVWLSPGLIFHAFNRFYVDGMIIIWAPSNTPNTSTYGSDISPEEAQYDKEHWKPRLTFRYDQVHRRWIRRNAQAYSIDAPLCRSTISRGALLGNTSLQVVRIMSPGSLPQPTENASKRLWSIATMYKASHGIP